MSLQRVSVCPNSSSLCQRGRFSLTYSLLTYGHGEPSPLTHRHAKCVNKNRPIDTRFSSVIVYRSTGSAANYTRTNNGGERNVKSELPQPADQPAEHPAVQSADQPEDQPADQSAELPGFQAEQPAVQQRESAEPPLSHLIRNSRSEHSIRVTRTRRWILSGQHSAAPDGVHFMIDRLSDSAPRLAKNQRCR